MQNRGVDGPHYNLFGVDNDDLCYHNRCQRDARTAVQHVMTQYVNYETAGKQFLGLDIRGSTWGFDDRGDAG